MKRPHLYRERGRWYVRPANAAGHKPGLAKVIMKRNRQAREAASRANNPRPCRLTSWVSWCPCHGWCL